MAKRVKKEEAELSDVGKLMVKNTLEDDKLKQEILMDLKKNPKYKEYFSTYNKQTVTAFINHYAEAKWRYLKYGDMYLKREDEETSRYKYRAEQYFWQIQQKKLFDKQCLWRAERIQIPEIIVSEDFNYWGSAIKTCPFIEPVSEEDFNTFMEFINSEYYIYDNDYEYIEWQSHYICSEIEDFAEDIPDYYRFMMELRNGGTYMKLPDIRGDKEQKYSGLAGKQRLEEYYAENPEQKNVVHDNRPMIGYNDDIIVDFIKQFEAPIMLEYHNLVDRNEYDDDGWPELSHALEDLKNAEEASAEWTEIFLNFGMWDRLLKGNVSLCYILLSRDNDWN